MAAQNKAAWLDAVGKPLRVAAAKMPKAGEGEVVIRNEAIAINPVSWKVQDIGVLVQEWPVILDYDVAGHVYEVGPGVRDFREGDRIVAWLQGSLNEDSKYGAFQLYSLAKVITTAKLPDSIPCSSGCVLPVAFNTALVSLCGPPGQGFGLPAPSLSPAAASKTIVVWGASSSIGIFTLQIARLAGVNAIAVASPHNFELCKSCGAAEVLDYREPLIVDKVVQTVKEVGGDFVGILDCISLPDESLKFSIPVLEQLGGGELGIVLPGFQPEIPSNSNIRVLHPQGRGQEITHTFWKDFITPALERGKLRCLPEPLIVGEGLESLQKGLDVQRKGVSAKKVVVTL